MIAIELLEVEVPHARAAEAVVPAQRPDGPLAPRLVQGAPWVPPQQVVLDVEDLAVPLLWLKPRLFGTLQVFECALGPSVRALWRTQGTAIVE